jgi:hypothetical protein
MEQQPTLPSHQLENKEDSYKATQQVPKDWDWVMDQGSMVQGAITVIIKHAPWS